MLEAGEKDEQEPHTEDEIYVCVSGRARFVTPASECDVAPGTVIFVPANEEHRFVDITERLQLVVVFGPAEGSRAPDGEATHPRDGPWSDIPAYRAGRPAPAGSAKLSSNENPVSTSSRRRSRDRDRGWSGQPLSRLRLCGFSGAGGSAGVDQEQISSEPVPSRCSSRS